MATEPYTCTEIIERRELDLAAGRFIERGVQRHVAFVVVEDILQETTEAQVTLTLTIRREDFTDDLTSYTACGQLVAAHA